MHRRSNAGGPFTTGRWIPRSKAATTSVSCAKSWPLANLPGLLFHLGQAFPWSRAAGARPAPDLPTAWPCGRATRRRAVIMADGKRLTAGDLELATVMTAPPPPDAESGQGKLRTGNRPGRAPPSPGKITSPALELGVSRPTVYELIEKLRIGRDSSVRTTEESDSLRAREIQPTDLSREHARLYVGYRTLYAGGRRNT
jgi:hypothetical protein